MRPVNQCSLYSVFMEMCTTNKNDSTPLVLMSATGFIYEHNGDKYLISNWHVFSAKDPNDPGKFLPGVGGDPEYVKVYFPNESAVDTSTIQEYPLINEARDKLWKEHPKSRLVDVAALKVDLPSGVATRVINEVIRNEMFFDREKIFHITREVWVVGFPKGVRIAGLPIWKRATIASEPRYSSQEVEHKIILDTATREGMSGSPVLYVNGEFTPIQFDGTNQEIDHASVKLLLGIYSGRIAGQDELSAQLGIVWSGDCLAEIFSGT